MGLIVMEVMVALLVNIIKNLFNYKLYQLDYKMVEYEALILIFFFKVRT